MERRTFTFEQQSPQLHFIVQGNEFLIWYDIIIIIKVDQKLSDLFQGTHSQTFNEVKVIPLKLFYSQTFFETWHNQYSWYEH